jgi:hypothetical protein
VEYGENEIAGCSNSCQEIKEHVVFGWSSGNFLIRFNMRVTEEVYHV